MDDIPSVSFIGPPSLTSLVQTAQAQQVASKQKDGERAKAEGPKRREDRLDLRVADAEHADAIRRLPSNDSEEAESEHRRQQIPHPRRAKDDDADDPPAHIDVTA